MGERILVVDDDPLVGDLTRYLLKDAGHEVELVSESREALAAIKARRPALVLLDILMPGIDGLTLCRQIKNDPELESLKVAIVSGKQFQPDREKARRFGADGFIDKPYHIDTFAEKIAEILARPTAARPEPAPKAAPTPAVFQVRIWGCRGEGAAPSRYGHRTACVSVEFQDKLFVFDAGTGLADLGAELSRSGLHKEQWLFLSGYSPERLAGLAAYPCAAEADCTLHVSGRLGLEEAFGAALGGSAASADIRLYVLSGDPAEIVAGARLTPFKDGRAFALEAEGRRLVYCPENDVLGEEPAVAGADLLIHGSGGDPLAAALSAAGQGVKRLILFGHEGALTDEELDRAAKEIKDGLAEKGYNLLCVMARDGMRFPV